MIIFIQIFCSTLDDIDGMVLCQYVAILGNFIRSLPVQTMFIGNPGINVLPSPDHTLRKKWSKNGSTPGAVSWYITQLHPWHYFGAIFQGRAVPLQKVELFFSKHDY